MEMYQGQSIEGCQVSEKFDGVQGVWTGEKLLTRTGKELNAPEWWLKGLPKHRLVGELFGGRNRFSWTCGAVKKKVPDERWDLIQFMVFEGNLPRRTKYHRQVQWLTFPTRRAFDAWYELILAHGGEGAVIKSDNGEVWKRKPVTDIDAVVIGHIEGKGRHVGRLGALLVRFEDGLEMKLGGGFKDHERENPPKVGAVVKIYHQGWTSKGLPRFAQFGGERVEDTLKFNEGR